MSSQLRLNFSANKKIVYLIDGSAYLYRAYHAIKGLTNSDGHPTNAIFGFTRMLINLLNNQHPKCLAIFFDLASKNFRHSSYPQYKANRKVMPEDLAKQLPWIKKIISGFRIQILEMNGFEADDLIGTSARIIQEKGMIAVIVSSDKDFMQLITNNCIIWDPMKNTIKDHNYVYDKFGVKPIQFIDVMGFSGDKSDNIPGVPGIGIKTAIELVSKFDSMEKCYQYLDSIDNKRLKDKLIKFKEQAFLSRNLVKINVNSPINIEIEKLLITKPNKNSLRSLFKKLEFKQLQADFTDKFEDNTKKYQVVFNIEMLDKLIFELKFIKRFAFNILTDSNDLMLSKLVGISISMRENEAFYIPVGHNYKNVPSQLPIDLVIKSLNPILTNSKIEKIGQNVGNSAIILMRYGIDIKGIGFDTKLASYLLNPSKKNHSISQVSMDFLDYKIMDHEELMGKGKHKISLNLIPIEKAAKYACETIDSILLARNIFIPILNKAGLIHLMQSVEIPLILILARMQLNGVCIDLNILKKLSFSLNIELVELKNKIYKAAGEIFNINSSKQLSNILFDKLKLPVQQKTKIKKSFSTDANVLTKLVTYHEIPGLIINYRKLSKLKSTYIDAIIDLINHDTGRIHTSFNQTITATGRLSSSHPNLQNIPVRTEKGQEIRKAFIPKRNYYFLSSDYSQIELRILAHYSKDEILINSFEKEEDIHIRTASEIFKINQESVTKDLRYQAKVVNFGIIYGMSSYRLANELNINAKTAQIYIDSYFNKYKGVKKFINQVIENTHLTEKVTTLLGRIRSIKDINSKNINVRKYAERSALNTIIQGTAADFIKIAMINIDKILNKNNFKTSMLLSVHDEIIFEVPKDELIKTKKTIRDSMESVFDLIVPLKVNINYGKNWAEIH